MHRKDSISKVFYRGVSSNGLGLEDANLNQHAGEVVDAALVHDLTIRKLEEEHAGDAECLAAGRKAEKAPMFVPSSVRNCAT